VVVMLNLDRCAHYATVTPTSNNNLVCITVVKEEGVAAVYALLVFRELS